MSEYIKGELKLNSDFSGLAQIDGITIFVVLPNNCETTEQLSRRKANAKELVRRWNAFEEGGTVEASRKQLLKYASHDPDCHKISRIGVDNNCTCDFEVAIAKAKKEG